MRGDIDCDLLVIGGGPTGVTLALLAAEAGLSVVVTEREADVYPLPRAAHIDHEVMRILQQVGVADKVMATSRRARGYEFRNADGTVLMSFPSGSGLTSAGWPSANMIHQPSVERALRARLAAQPRAHLRPRWAFQGLSEAADNVAATFHTPEGPTTMTARWLVGADGARSPVRVAAGIEVDDLRFDEPWLVIDTLVQDVTRLPEDNLQICDPARPTTCVMMGEGRHRWEFMILPGERPEDLLDDAMIERLLEPWDVKGAVTLERKAVYRFNARVAKTWRKGRVLLAGDAAHQMPPFAGQGLCSGLCDAANLAWKLAAVAQGRASDALLDTYQQERDPHVRALIDVAIMMGRTVCITDPVAAAARDAAMLADAAGPKRAMPSAETAGLKAGCLGDGPAAGAYFPQWVHEDSRLDDVLGPGAWLLGGVAEAGPATSDITFARLDDPKLSPFASNLESWLAARGGGAVLVRPDRYVFSVGDPAGLRAAWRGALITS